MNIRTLRDLDGPNADPLPDPWKTYPKRYSSQVEGIEHVGLSQTGVQFQYIGLDGNKNTLNQTETPNIPRLCGLVCCPCFVPPFCSDTKKREYLNFVKTFCFVISVIQCIILIVALSIGGFAPPSMNPSLGPPASTFILLGAKDSALMQQGQVWRFVIPIFLHAGFIHIFFNVFAQLRFGMALERRWGRVKLILIYFVSGIAGVLMSCLLRPAAISVGASGAIMGLMGAYLSEIFLTWHKTDPRFRRLNLFQTLFVIAITMLISISPYIDAGAHFGGLLIGFWLGCIFFAVEWDKVTLRRVLPIVSIGIVLCYFALGFALFWTVIHVQMN